MKKTIEIQIKNGVGSAIDKDRRFKTDRMSIGECLITDKKSMASMIPEFDNKQQALDYLGYRIGEYVSNNFRKD